MVCVCVRARVRACVRVCVCVCVCVCWRVWGGGWRCIQPCKLHCYIWKVLIKSSLRFSIFFCVFVSKGNLLDFCLWKGSRLICYDLRNWPVQDVENEIVPFATCGLHIRVSSNRTQSFSTSDQFRPASGLRSLLIECLWSINYISHLRWLWSYCATAQSDQSTPVAYVIHAGGRFFVI